MDQPVAPSEFLDRLEEAFQGRLRLRWSPRGKVWRVEQKVGRSLPPLRSDPYDDTRVCARDGYAPVMAFTPSNYTFCPFCQRKIAVPLFASEEIGCSSCMAMGRDARWQAAYFPLGERLIDYLRMISPEGQDAIKRVRQQDEEAQALKDQKIAADEREAHELAKDDVIDQFPVAGFPTLTPDSWRH